VTTHYEGRLGSMSLASTIHRYPLVATWSRRFVGPRFALAGDAAVGMHPVTAHGFNLGLASVEHLAQAAGDGWRRHGDPGDAALLARYQRRHRMSSAPMFAGTQLLLGVFTGPHAFLRPLRRVVMSAGSRVPALRRALAANLVDDGPRPASLARHLRVALGVLRPRLGPARPHA
jgi:2-polyprenyl-6-methoxyphenol hydroxylase-like FAD-dependent oxidoreductase